MELIKKIENEFMKQKEVKITVQKEGNVPVFTMFYFRKGKKRQHVIRLFFDEKNLVTIDGIYSKVVPVFEDKKSFQLLKNDMDKIQKMIEEHETFRLKLLLNEFEVKQKITEVLFHEEQERKNSELKWHFTSILCFNVISIFCLLFFKQNLAFHQFVFLLTSFFYLFFKINYLFQKDFEKKDSFAQRIFKTKCLFFANQIAMIFVYGISHIEITIK